MPKAQQKKTPKTKTLSLTENELLKMEKFSTQVRACDSEQIVTMAQKNGYIQKIDPQGVLSKFDQKIAALSKERQDAEAAYKAVCTQVEGRLGIKLSEYAYDDATGVLRQIPTADT